MMADDNNQFLTSFIQLLSRPEENILPLLLLDQKDSTKSRTSRKQLRETCQLLFKEVEGLSRSYNELTQKAGNKTDFDLSGLDQLHVGSDEQPMDAETMWGQVEMQNAALNPFLRKSLKRLVKSVLHEEKDELRLLDLGGDVSEDEQHKEEPRDHQTGDSGERSSREEDDEEARQMRERMERAMADMEEADSENEHGSEEKSKEDETDDEESLVDPAAEELNNGFFDINEMEAFADEEEAYLPDEAFRGERQEHKEEKNIMSFHQRQRMGDIDQDEDSEEEDNFFGEPRRNEKPLVRRRKYRDDDEIDALYKLYETPKSDEDDSDSVVNMTAADLFGKPDKKHFHKWQASEKAANDDSDDADSWDVRVFENDAPGWRDHKVSEEVNEYEAENEDGHSHNSENNISQNESPKENESGHGKHSDKLLQQTEQLEKEIMAEKPWQMTGEAKSMLRPVNSLLEATPEFEVATKMAPLITIEHTTDLEDIIKHRILNEDWDDVIPRELPDVGWNKKRSELPEVSQEQSKLGLGELYEREYLKKAVGYDIDATEKHTEEEKAKNEMKALFASLCSKLDALTNYHFAPRPISDEADVRPVTTPAIVMEEVLPLHVSDARGVAPEEVYGKKRGRMGVLRGETELDQTERKRFREAKKAARRKARKGKLADEKLISKLQPGLGLNNPYEKRKMREELSVARAQGKVTTGEMDANLDYAASGKFFKRMQEDVEHTDSSDVAPRRKKSSGTRLSSALKL